MKPKNDPAKVHGMEGYSHGCSQCRKQGGQGGPGHPKFWLWPSLKKFWLATKFTCMYKHTSSE